MKRKTAPAPPPKQKLWLLLINHKEGTNVYVHSTKELAEAMIVEWAKREWRQEVGWDVPIPNPFTDDDLWRYLEASEEDYSIEIINVDEVEP